MFGKQQRKKTRRTTRKVKKVSVPVKNAIVKAVRNNLGTEVKFASTWNGQMLSANEWGILYNSGITAVSNVSLLPEIPIGNQVGQRTGNRINPRRLEVDFWVTAANYSNSLDFVARFLILQSRNLRNATVVNTVAMNTLLDWGQTQGPFEGYTSHLSAPINKDEFFVLMDRKITMDKTLGVNPAITNAYASSAVGQSPNLIHHFKVVLKTPKVLHYDDGIATLPSGYAPFFNCGYAQPSRNGVDIPDTSITGLSVYFTSTLYYTDA